MEDASRNHIVLGCRPWSRQVFDTTIRRLPRAWQYWERPEDVNPDRLAALNPRYLFFLHWSWKVPAQVVADHECVCFHMTDLPYGRGGSPLQNLILRGHTESVVTALRMTEQLDAGPIYTKRPLSLAGSAEEVYFRANQVSAEIIAEIVRTEPTPAPQEGEPVVFRRRKPEESELPADASAEQLYDFIRMLDAPGYPRAYVNHAGRRLEFSDARLVDGRLEARVTVAPEPSTKG